MEHATESATKSYEAEVRTIGQVERQTDRLAGLLDGIDKAIASLRERLAPALLPDDPMPDGGSAEEPMMCGHAERLASLADQADRFVTALRVLHDRVDL